MTSSEDPRIQPLRAAADAEACARLMAATDPWKRLGRSHETCLAAVRDQSREVYVAPLAGAVAGFVIICLIGPFVGYIQTVCVAPEQRGRGVGRRLIAFAEERIAGVSPNVFLCVSSFNPRAKALYERLGYEFVGELRDYLVRGHSELLYRKSSGSWTEFRSATP